MSPLGKISTPPDGANLTAHIYERITVRLDGKRLTYRMRVEYEDMGIVRGCEIDDPHIPLILGKSSIIRRTPMELINEHLRPIRNPCGRCRQSVPERSLCIMGCKRMVCPGCLAENHVCKDCAPPPRYH